MLGLLEVVDMVRSDCVLGVMLVEEEEETDIPALSDLVKLVLDKEVAVLLIMVGFPDIFGESGQGKDSDFLFSLFSL